MKFEAPHTVAHIEEQAPLDGRSRYLRIVRGGHGGYHVAIESLGLAGPHELGALGLDRSEFVALRDALTREINATFPGGELP